MNNQLNIPDWSNGIILIKKNKKIIYTKETKENCVSYSNYSKDPYFEDIFLMLNSNLFNFDYLLHEYLNENN
jgi:hypothetical protein